ncbi:MAG TPA: outer membrane lipoprotein-sorting protein, partial [Desulfobacteraceae bacterium]|nr:outer membrane lipoprotein-sorting protein [Desulfobacteraceae bacterium]
MKRLAFLFFFLVLTGLVAEPLFAQTSDSDRARAILQKIDALWRSTSSVARLKMVVKTEHYTRTLVLDRWTKGKEKSLVRIVSPL